ncbi:MAG: hypothetical protein GY841_10185 [FCB group bacterium]|nr:hypothetical protein [FCB group bacterium]
MKSVYVIEWGNGNTDVFADRAEALSSYGADYNRDDDAFKWARDGGEVVYCGEFADNVGNGYTHMSDDARSKLGL